MPKCAIRINPLLMTIILSWVVIFETIKILEGDAGRIIGDILGTVNAQSSKSDDTATSLLQHVFHKDIGNVINKWLGR